VKQHYLQLETIVATTSWSTLNRIGCSQLLHKWSDIHLFQLSVFTNSCWKFLLSVFWN